MTSAKDFKLDVTLDKFDKDFATEIEAELRAWAKDEAQPFDDAVFGAAPGGGAVAAGGGSSSVVAQALGSQTIIAAIVGILEPRFGVEFPPECVVKAGGYDTPDEMVSDMMTRLRALCVPLPDEEHKTE